MIQNRALQFIDTVSKHSTAGCVLDAMGKVLNSIGIDFFCMQLLPTPGAALITGASAGIGSRNRSNEDQSRGTPQVPIYWADKPGVVSCAAVAAVSHVAYWAGRRSMIPARRGRFVGDARA
jgi:hypothetical protein